MQIYNWPGNGRELENIIERAVLLFAGEIPEPNLPAAAKNLFGSSHPFADMPTMDEMQRH